MIEPSRILQEFSLKGALIAIDEIDNGLINNTYLVELEERSGKKKRYVLQRINDQVFTEPEKVMQNIALVTQHLGDNERSLKLFPTKEGENYFRCDAGCWRCYNFIENAITYDECESEEVAHNAAFAFATFSYQLSKLQPESLHTTIPDFHHTQNTTAAIFSHYNSLTNYLFVSLTTIPK